ncbi:hypothetical protein GW17_00012331 [Ensete ventricosum]|nr:hypothetical protein GW17_00012331 [Ensete ventricosum]RZR77100.1 hypothetical protein BHM03_00002076 [Ensete ventricosum]
MIFLTPSGVILLQFLCVWTYSQELDPRMPCTTKLPFFRFCPCCKKPQQASKKLDLWRLPEVLVIHLKRFSYSRYMKNKLETLVDFPIHDLDLSTYIAGMPEQASNNYRLYAVSNHYGNMGGGHYTAYVYDERENRWYDFDDRSVSPIAEESIKTSAAYVLFYRRT